MPRAKSNVPPPETPRPTGGASRRRRRAQHSLGHLTSTDVTAELFFRGHRVNRNRLGEVADALWLNGEIRENPYNYRRFSPDQVEQVALALDLSDDLGVPLEEISELVQVAGSINAGLLDAIGQLRARLDTIEDKVRQVAQLQESAGPQQAMSA